MKVLIIDNYDSFVYNLAQYVGELGATPHVFRNDGITMPEIEAMRPERIIISPGPGNPTDGRSIGICGEMLQTISRGVPTLGVCLGHQGIGAVFGAKIIRASRLMHGKTSRILHDGRGVLKGVSNPFEATRYHSLVIDRNHLPDCLRVTAVSQDDVEIMGVRHTKYPIEGVQYHPESIMTREGMTIVKNFLDRGVGQD